MDLNRRQLIKAALLGVGGLGLRGLPLGLPAFLARRAAAAEPCDAANPSLAQQQRLILVTSAAGDPLNANVPGCYISDPNLYHPATGSNAPYNLDFTTQSPWLNLASWAPAGTANILDRTCFFHHGTYTSAHGDHAKVNTLMGAVRRQEMLISLIARHLSGCNPISTQAPPVVLSDVLIRYQGAVQPVLNRSALHAVLADPPAGARLSLRNQRDTDMGALAELFRTGTQAQQLAVDEYLQAQAAARKVDQGLVATLAGNEGHNPGNAELPDPANSRPSGTGPTYSPGSQDRRALNTAAMVLFQMHVTPVVVMEWSFGGDNHGNLGIEYTDTIDSLYALADLWYKLTHTTDPQTGLALSETVTIAFMNVFGRTLGAAARSQSNTNGRDHNAGHHCSVLIGPGFQRAAGRGHTIVGGVVRTASGDYRATGFESATGTSNDAAGDVTYLNTLATAGKTLAAAMGMSEAVINDQITSGVILRPQQFA